MAERDRAVDTIAGAYRTARHLGSKPLARRCAQALEAMGESVERRLGRLAARNRAIADQLYISVRTVDMHVRNLLSKLGCSSRSAATRRAVELKVVMTTISERVARAKGQIENLAPDQVFEELEAGAVLVDLREAGELESDGKIDGAVHAPRGMLEFYADPTSPYHREEFDPSRRTILYCASGGRSALGAVALQELGYTDVAHLEGGIKAWNQAVGEPTKR